MPYPVFRKVHRLARELMVTPACVRLRVRLGQMHPDAKTEDGTWLWSPEAFEEELFRDARLRYLALRHGVSDTNRWLQRQERREPLQLSIRAEA
jgi:hypothetical protein